MFYATRSNNTNFKSQLIEWCYFIIPFHKMHTELHAEITIRSYSWVMSLLLAQAWVYFSVFSKLFMISMHIMPCSFQAGFSLVKDWETLSTLRISMEVMCEVRSMPIPQRSDSFLLSEDFVRTKAMNMLSRFNKLWENSQPLARLRPCTQCILETCSATGEL